MTLDIRLACLRDAIVEDWTDLEAYEVDGTLVIRIRKNVEAGEPGKTKQPEKQSR